MGTHEAVKEVSSATQSSDAAGDGPPPTPITLAIYRDLRVGMVVIMVMLAAALVTDTISAKYPQSTLSAYYYTSAHCIFIAALLALSTLFFVYRGSSDTEDALLTLAGVCALTAALVPQGRPPVGGAKGLSGVFADAFDDLEVRESFLPLDYDVGPIIERNVWAVVVALFLGWLLMWWQHRHNKTQPTRSPGGTLSLWFLRLIVLLGLITLVIPPLRPLFKGYAHGAAGILMLSAFIATVICTAYLVGHDERSTHRRRYQLIYWVIAGAMLVTLIAVVLLHFIRPNWWKGDLEIIMLESFLILLFAAYWVVQTHELWDSPDRRERLSEGARDRLAQGRTTRGLNGLKTELFCAKGETRDEWLLRLL